MHQLCTITGANLLYLVVSFLTPLFIQLQFAAAHLTGHTPLQKGAWLAIGLNSLSSIVCLQGHVCGPHCASEAPSVSQPSYGRC